MSSSSTGRRAAKLPGSCPPLLHHPGTLPSLPLSARPWTRGQRLLDFFYFNLFQKKLINEDLPISLLSYAVGVTHEEVTSCVVGVTHKEVTPVHMM
jgi:hypothetical protein